MSRRHPILIATLLVFPLTAAAGRASPEDHINCFREPEPQTVDGVSFTVEDAIARADVAKLALSINNGTNDWVLVDVGETNLVFEHGTYPNGRRTERIAAIRPQGTKKPTIEVSGRADLHVEAFTVEVNGVSRVDTKGTTQAAEPFMVPASTNAFQAGPFDCSLLKLKKVTKVTEATFECNYRGDEVGLVDSSRLVWRIESGQEFANFDRKARQHLVLPGDKLKFSALAEIEGRIVDMQFANMWIVWNDTFSESEREAFAPVRINLHLDPVETATKN